MQMKPTDKLLSARSLVDTLGGQGISQDAIGPVHLECVYAQLREIPSRPDIAGAESILARLPVGGEWGKHPFAVIVENRDLPQLAYVIENVVQYTGYPVQLFHGPGNRSVLDRQSISQLKRRGRLVATEMPEVVLDADIYNALLLDRRFYEALQGRGQFLIFQTDSLCCPGADFTLDDFSDYDYVGAAWDERRAIGLCIKGGCGGFSFRNWQSSVDTLDRFPAADWPGGEDSYFAFHMDVSGCRVADSDVSASFATQDVFRHRSFGAHQVRQLSPADHVRFLQYCPEVRHVLNWRI